MRIAYIHDWLVFPGGAEGVFFDIVNDKLLKDIDKTADEKRIFTAFHHTDFPNESNLTIEAAISNNSINRYYRHLMPFFPFFMKRLSKKIRKFNPDVAIISSFAIAKNLDLGKNTKKILYLHSPMQYIRTHYEEYAEKMKTQGWLKHKIYKWTSLSLRRWDLKYTDFDQYYFNSAYTQRTFKETYGLDTPEGKIENPLVKIPKYEKTNISETLPIKNKDYFIYIGRLVKFVKRVDIIIKAFNKTGHKLLIVGDGPDKGYLQSIAGNNIIFSGYMSNDSNEYWNLLENSKGLVNITKESFGIVTKQALDLGIPVIGLNKGATPELEGKKVLIEEANEENLIEALKQF